MDFKKIITLGMMLVGGGLKCEITQADLEKLGIQIGAGVRDGVLVAFYKKIRNSFGEVTEYRYGLRFVQCEKNQFQILGRINLENTACLINGIRRYSAADKSIREKTGSQSFLADFLKNAVIKYTDKAKKKISSIEYTDQYDENITITQEVINHIMG